MTKAATAINNTTQQTEESSLSVVASTTGLKATTTTTKTRTGGRTKASSSSSSSSSASTFPTISSISSNFRPTVRTATTTSGTSKASSQKTTPSKSAALDFITTGQAVKTLFSIPYDESRKPVCLAVHNLDGTLIIDQAEDEQNYFLNRRQHDAFVGSASPQPDHLPSGPATETPSPSSLMIPPSSESLALVLSPGNKSSEALALLSNVVQQSTSAPPVGAMGSTNDTEPKADDATLLTPPTPPREYVEWKFQDMNLLVGSDAMVVRPTNTPEMAASSTNPSSSSAPELPPPAAGITVRVEEVQQLRNAWTSFQQVQQELLRTQQLPSSSTSSNASPSRQQHRSYAQALLRAPPEEESTNHNNTSNKDEGDNSPGKPDRDDSDDVAIRKEKQEDSTTFSETPLQTCIVPFSGPLGGRLMVESSSISPDVSNSSSSPQSALHPSSSDPRPVSSTPALSIVIDAYLDNLMANVPQLALCLQEKGLIQSIKLLATEDIPSRMIHPATLDTSFPVDTVRAGGQSKASNIPFPARRHNHHQGGTESDMFSPQIMEMNASALLRFLKNNCTRNNATYLLRHEPAYDGNNPAYTTHHNIQLYDISSISNQGQKKWIWWLATMSYRFAVRLRHLEVSPPSTSTSTPTKLSQMTESQRRAIRDRERSLFQQTLDLLQDLTDMDGNAHESMVASVREHMADTYLRDGDTSMKIGVDHDTMAGTGGLSSVLSPSQSPTIPPALVRSQSPPASGGLHQAISSETTSQVKPATFPEEHQQPYATISVDALSKAQDHLLHGIRTLTVVIQKDAQPSVHGKPTSASPSPDHVEAESERTSHGRRRRQRPGQPSSDDRRSGGADEEKEEPERYISPAMIMQLMGMNYKLVNVSLRLAEHHLKNYYSSSAMQSLRTAARRLAEAAHLLDFYRSETGTDSSVSMVDVKWKEAFQLQYIWLLEHCGHFARSFASDDLWRDRGHASGDDVISVLRDVELAFTSSDESRYVDSLHRGPFWILMKKDPLLVKSGGRVSLQSLSAVLPPSKLDKNTSQRAIDATETFLATERFLQRDKRRVLVASCVSYGRAIEAFQDMTNEEKLSSSTNNDVTTPTTKSTTSKIGNPESTVARTHEPVLNLLRQRLGDSCNETGKVLLGALRSLLMNIQGGKGDDSSQAVADVLIESAQFWFTEGLDAFASCGDVRNLALLRCNLCQSYKLRANAVFARDDKANSANGNPSRHAEYCLEEAANQLLKAHENLGERDADARTWDMVSEELAATFLVLGVRRRQSLLGGGSTPVTLQAGRLSPGEERSITDPMERSLKIYEQSGNMHQAAAAHYQLALTYSKLWTCQLNESKTREKLSAAFDHYSRAYSFFATNSRFNEPTFCLLCLDLASLYATVAGEEGMFKALGCCLDTCDSFSLETIRAVSVGSTLSHVDVKQWYEKMETLAESIEERVFKLLRNLVKADPDRFKDVYRDALSAKMVQSVDEDDHEFVGNLQAAVLLKLHEILLAIKKKFGTLIKK